eukprot:1159212-Pelagomonas_calceolata.AAC.9
MASHPQPSKHNLAAVIEHQCLASSHPQPSIHSLTSGHSTTRTYADKRSSPASAVYHPQPRINRLASTT